MSHGVMCYWFLLNFFFISAFSDILAYQFLAFFEAAFQADENPPALTFPEQILNVII